MVSGLAKHIRVRPVLELLINAASSNTDKCRITVGRANPVGRANSLIHAAPANGRLGNHQLGFYVQDTWKVTRKLISSRPDVDVDGLVGIGRSRRVIGTSYATERRAVEYFDPAIALLSRQLSAALPGRPEVSIIDSTVDGSKLLIRAASDTNPGMIYLYDKATRHMEALLPVRAELAQRTLATVTPITYTAADGTQIPAYLTLPPGSDGKGIPAIVMPHGGPAARDE